MLGIRLFIGSEKSGLTVVNCKLPQEQRVLLVSPTLAELVKEAVGDCFKRKAIPAIFSKIQKA